MVWPAVPWGHRWRRASARSWAGRPFTGWLAVHHRGPDGDADRLVTLVEAAVLERHDAGARPRPGSPGLDDLGDHVDGVPGEHRRWEVDPGEAEVGDRGPEGQLMDRQADDQAQREQAVHQRFPELGAGRELRVEVQR